jgi:hypothetical protein
VDTEDEKPLALMRRANLRRCEESALNRAAQSLKVSIDAVGAAGREHPADVFNEYPPGGGLDEDPPGDAPQIALIVLSKPLSGEGMRLARDSAKYAIQQAAPAAAVEGSGIRPHSGGSHETLFHRFDQDADGEGFPLYQTDCSSRWNCQLDGEIEATAAGADGQTVEGR